MAPTISRTSAEPTLYEVLSLTPKQLEGQASAAQQKAIKQAYHKALLKHHPDKNKSPLEHTDSSSSSSSQSPDTSAPSSPPPQSKPASKSSRSKQQKPSSSIPKSQLTYTVDQIQHAYSVLSNTQQRRDYDRELRLVASASSSSHYTSTSFSTTGVETVDLDDLDFNERTGVYFRSCRCGNPRGYRFTEDQLAEYEDDLVLLVQCLDCSLWIRVLFDAADDDDEDEEEEQNANEYTSTPSVPMPSQQQQQQWQQQQQQFRPTATTLNRQNGETQATRRDSGSSHNVKKSGKGWGISLGLNLGISLGGSGSASARRN